MKQWSTESVEAAIREYLPKVVHLSLATCRNDKPWVCELHYSYDDNLNLYFLSKESRRHSEELAKNHDVAGNIVMQFRADDDVRGVYFEGTAQELTAVDENHLAFLTYSKRFDTDAGILEEAKAEDGHKFYKIAVEKFYLFDTQESVPGKKYELPWLMQK
jgi:uncharacterized protein YhbP (UPF0306 family)